MPTKRQQAKAAKLVAMGRAMQARAGAAALLDKDEPKPEDPGGVVTGEVIRSYLNRVDGGYKSLASAADKAFAAAHGNKFLISATEYMGEWWPALKRWEVFYKEASDDWLPSGSTYSETRNYHLELLHFRDRFESAMGQKPPHVPELATPDPSGGVIGQLTTLVKWGVVGYVGIVFVNGFLSGYRGGKK